MIKPILTTLLVTTAAVALVLSLRPDGAAAATQVPVELPRGSFQTPVLPDVQAPLDMTPITPAESAGAPMYEH